MVNAETVVRTTTQRMGRREQQCVGTEQASQTTVRSVFHQILATIIPTQDDIRGRARREIVGHHLELCGMSQDVADKGRN